MICWRGGFGCDWAASHPSVCLRFFGGEVQPLGGDFLVAEVCVFVIRPILRFSRYVKFREM